MFQHITVLFSFVFAIALTHVLSCVSKLILARDRVHFSGLHALWMLNALMLLLINRLASNPRDYFVQLGWAIPQLGQAALAAMDRGLVWARAPILVSHL